MSELPIKLICEVCNEREAVGVCSTSIPYSAAYCEECLQAGVDPYWVVVANTACINGLEHSNDEWKEQVNRTLKHLNKTKEQFNIDVAKSIKDLDSASL